MNAEELKKGDKVIYLNHGGMKTKAEVIKATNRRVCAYDGATSKVLRKYITLNDGDGERTSCWLQVLIDAAEKRPGEPYDIAKASEEMLRKQEKKKLYLEIKVAKSTRSTIQMRHKQLKDNPDDRANRQNRFRLMNAKIQYLDKRIEELERRYKAI